MSLSLPVPMEGQLVVVAPDVGGRLILTDRTGIVGAREWVEHVASTRGATIFHVSLVEGDQITPLGSVTADEAGGWL